MTYTTVEHSSSRLSSDSLRWLTSVQRRHAIFSFGLFTMGGRILRRSERTIWSRLSGRFDCLAPTPTCCYGSCLAAWYIPCLSLIAPSSRAASRSRRAPAPALLARSLARAQLELMWQKFSCRTDADGRGRTETRSIKAHAGLSGICADGSKDDGAHL